MFANSKKVTTFAPAIERESVGRETIKIIGALVQLVRIHACHAWGHGFESRLGRFSNCFTITVWDLSSAGRASALQAEGRRFESVNAHRRMKPCTQ